MTPIPWALYRIPKSRIWFYKPERWFDWKFAYFSHDEFSRNTLVLGWPVTGRVIIALRYRGDSACYRESIQQYENDERRSEK